MIETHGSVASIKYLPFTAPVQEDETPKNNL